MTDAMSAAVQRTATQHAERQLSAEEARDYLSAPVSDAEREDALALVNWFQTRYPTGAERLAYIRRANARWTRGR